MVFTALGPATLPFTPPSSCLETTTYTYYYTNDADSFTVGPHGFTLGTDPDCFPSPTGPEPWEPAQAHPFVVVYSPGVCPVGYTYATPCTLRSLRT
jgi:hypothetical protein